MPENDIKKFGADFDQIDRVKGADKILIQDSADGIVKYATPGQVMSMFDQLESDSQIAAQAAETAVNAKNDAQSSKTAAAQSATSAATSKSQAQTFAEDAAEAADDAHSATDIVAEGTTDVEARLSSLEREFRKLISGEMVVEKIALRALALYGEMSFMKSGDGAPTTAPDFVPQFYFDKTNKAYYRAKGNSSVSDWASF